MISCPQLVVCISNKASNATVTATGGFSDQTILLVIVISILVTLLLSEHRLAGCIRLDGTPGSRGVGDTFPPRGNEL
jgi:hypothetical protein